MDEREFGPVYVKPVEETVLCADCQAEISRDEAVFGGGEFEELEDGNIIYYCEACSADRDRDAEALAEMG